MPHRRVNETGGGVSEERRGAAVRHLNLARLLEELMWLPADAFAPVLTMPPPSRLRYVLPSEPLRRRQAVIHHYGQSRIYNGDEFPPDG